MWHSYGRDGDGGGVVERRRGDGGGDAGLGGEAALLRMAKEEAVQGETGVRVSRASTGGDKGALRPDTATLGRTPTTRGHPRVHVAANF